MEQFHGQAVSPPKAEYAITEETYTVRYVPVLYNEEK
jgi:hypothetical protein